MSDTTEDTVTLKPKRNLVTGYKDTTFVYAIFLTPNGKGYGCFAIKKGDVHNSFLVGASYCHPNDRRSFRKKIARDIAVGRAANKFTFDPELNLDSLHVVSHAITAKTGSIDMPSWAERAYDVGSFSYKLSLDRYSERQLLTKLIKEDSDVAKDFLFWVADLYKQTN